DQVLRVHVGYQVAFGSGSQEARDVSDTGSDFHDRGSQVRLDGFRHPPVETWRRRKRLQRLRASIFVNVARQAGPQDHVEGLQAVLEPDLLALFISPSVVGDRRFIDSGPALGKLNGQFRLNAKTVAAYGNALDQRC